MNLLRMLLKLAVFAVVAVAALTIVGKVRQRTAGGSSGGGAGASRAAADDRLSEAGFFLLSRTEASNPRVTIVSLPNCPSHEAQLARNLESALQAAGVPCEMKSEIAFNFTDPADIARVNKYTAAGIANPLVVVRGWAKGNPSADQVIAQYQVGR